MKLRTVSLGVEAAGVIARAGAGRVVLHGRNGCEGDRCSKAKYPGA